MTKDELIEEHRYINTELDGWWDHVFEDFIGRIKRKGVSLDADDIMFSGFGSQGDGALFMCVIDGEDFDRFCKEHELYKEYPILKTAVAYECDPYIRVERQTYRYFHANCTNIFLHRTYTFFGMMPSDGLDDIRADMMKGLDDQWDELHEPTPHLKEGVNTHIAEILRRYMNDLYRMLEKEHDYLTSDDAVWDSVTANGLDEIEEDDDDTT